MVDEILGFDPTDPLRPDDTTIDGTSFNFIDQISGLRADVMSLSNRIREIKDVSEMMKSVGAFMPIGVQTETKDLKYGNDMTDRSFAARLGAIERTNHDPLQRMLAYGKFLKKMVIFRKEVLEKINKLNERIKLQGGCAEVNAAKILKKRLNDSLRVLDIRMGKVFEKYFWCMQKSVDAIAKISGAVAALFPDGDKNMRSAALKYSCRDALSSLDVIQAKMVVGRHTEEMKTVRI